MNDRAFPFKDLETFFKENQEPQYRYKQTLQAIFQSPHLNFESLTNLPLGLRQKLKETFGESLLPIHLLEVKDDPQAHKYLFEFNDSASLTQMSTVLNKYITEWISNKTLSKGVITVSKDPYSDERVNVNMTVQFQGTIGIISVDITIE